MIKDLCLLLIAALAWTAVPAAAQTEQALIQEQLALVMAREQPLTSEDVRIYIENAETIFRLRFEPEKTEETAAAIKAWTPSRFAYVTAKIPIGLHQILRPDAPRGALNAPEFARPSEPELTIIRRSQEELISTLERLQTLYAPETP